MKLTPEQTRAVNHPNGNLQLIACAGSGKTEVVARSAQRHFGLDHGTPDGARGDVSICDLQLRRTPGSSDQRPGGGSS